MTRTVVIEPEADEDLARAFAWYEQTSLGTRYAFIEAMREAVARLIETPDGSTTVPGAPSGHVVRRVFVVRFVGREFAGIADACREERKCRRCAEA